MSGLIGETEKPFGLSTPFTLYVVPPDGIDLPILAVFSDSHPKPHRSTVANAFRGGIAVCSNAKRKLVPTLQGAVGWFDFVHIASPHRCYLQEFGEATHTAAFLHESGGGVSEKELRVVFRENVPERVVRKGSCLLHATGAVAAEPDDSGTEAHEQQEKDGGNGERVAPATTFALVLGKKVDRRRQAEIRREAKT
jgi:hypothetical protein